MRVLFDIGMSSHLRHFDTVLNELRGRGHEVITKFCYSDLFGQERRSVRQFENHRQAVNKAVIVRTDGWGELSYAWRNAMDYLTYHHPDYSGTSLVKQRTRNMLAFGIGPRSQTLGEELADFVDALEAPQRDRLLRILAQAEQAAPPAPATAESLREIAPDLLCVSPLVYTQYGQADLVKAAKALDIPVIFLANSWDNLTTKGTIHTLPDRTIVWNEIQMREAERYHRIPGDSIAVTGAPRFDAFFARGATLSHASFCEKLDFDPAAATILYLGSSNLISANEQEFVLRWARALRQSNNSELARVNILIRPHPKFREGWEAPFVGLERVAVSSGGNLMQSLNNDESLYNSIFHSRAVVGANTSAELEAAILDKPVFTVKDPEMESGQEGTIHFGYLLRENGGFVVKAADLESHLEQLAQEFSSPPEPGRNRAFVESFLRPGGLDRPATEVTADAIEAMARDLGAGTRRAGAAVSGGAASAKGSAAPSGDGQAGADPAAGTPSVAADYRERIYREYFAVHVAPRKGKLTPARLRKHAKTYQHHFGSFLPKDRRAAIVDVGCGAGGLVFWLQQRGFKKAAGIDTSRDMVEAAKRLEIPNIKRADLRAFLEPRPDHFDLIFMRDVLEHIDKRDVLSVLDLCFASLRQGGQLVLQVPNGSSPFVGRVLYGDFTHETAFTTSSLQQLLLLVGFDSVAFKPFEPRVPEFPLWRRWLTREGRRVMRSRWAWSITRWLYTSMLDAEVGKGQHIVTFNLIASATKGARKKKAAGEKVRTEDARPGDEDRSFESTRQPEEDAAPRSDSVQPPVPRPTEAA